MRVVPYSEQQHHHALARTTGSTASHHDAGVDADAVVTSDSEEEELVKTNTHEKEMKLMTPILFKSFLESQQERPKPTAPSPPPIFRINEFDHGGFPAIRRSGPSVTPPMNENLLIPMLGSSDSHVAQEEQQTFSSFPGNDEGPAAEPESPREVDCPPEKLFPLYRENAIRLEPRIGRFSLQDVMSAPSSLMDLSDNEEDDHSLQLRESTTFGSPPSLVDYLSENDNEDDDEDVPFVVPENLVEAYSRSVASQHRYEAWLQQAQMAQLQDEDVEDEISSSPFLAYDYRPRTHQDEWALEEPVWLPKQERCLREEGEEECKSSEPDDRVEAPVVPGSSFPSAPCYPVEQSLSIESIKPRHSTSTEHRSNRRRFVSSASVAASSAFRMGGESAARPAVVNTNRFEVTKEAVSQATNNATSTSNFASQNPPDGGTLDWVYDLFSLACGSDGGTSAMGSITPVC